ncbi:MAG: hypothetical protein KF857_03730 [Fimbriimonadaceae bacterium]|nr:hypothetical protein [Fimbriimonadaceae bacterium]
MKTRSILSFAAVAVLAVAFAQSAGQAGSFKDRAGKFGVNGILSPSVESDPRKGTLHFDFAGKPLTGFSKDQGLQFRALRAEGDLLKVASAYNVQAVTLTGDVWLKVTQSDARTKGSNEVEAKSAQLTVVDGAEQAKVTSPGAITVTSIGSGQGTRRIDLKGPNATMTLDPLTQKSDDPLRTVLMTGGVTVVVDSVAVDKDGKENKVSLTATGSRLTYDRATREVVLSGDVKVSGTNTSPGDGQDIVFSGTLSGKEFRLKIDKNNEVAGWSLGQGKAGFREGG